MAILITGGCGFIGSNLVRHLVLDRGETVVNLDKLAYSGNPRSLADLESDERYVFERVDLCDPDAVREVMERHRPDAVMHLAAESHVDRSIDGPGDFIHTNIVGTFNLLQGALGHWRELEGPAKEAFRFLHVSTDEVFGSLGPDDPPFSANTPYDPHSPYSASKASSDHLVRAWHDTYGLPVLITNCSNNYGPYQFPEKLLPVVILKCLRDEEIPVYGKGENVRDWLYVEDHCRALCRVLEAGTVGRTYTVGGDNECRNIDLVREVCRILDRLAPAPSGASHEERIAFVTDRPGHDLRYAIDASVLRDELGWAPRETAGTGLEKTVRWYLEHRDWWEDILAGAYRLERLGTGGEDSGS